MKPAIHEVLRKTPEGRSLLREEELAKVRACRDIVRDWDDPDDFSLWREVFASSRSSASAAATPTSARKRFRELPSHSRTSDVHLTFSDALTGIFSANLDSPCIALLGILDVS